jgi:sterol desaturase/sphingolipid hydroxylase (fatty acid hydroxylase superfamily)
MTTFLQLLSQLPPFAVDIIRLCIWLVLLMIVFIPLERLFSQHPQKVFRQGFLTDLGYYFISSLIPTHLLVVPMAFIAWGLHSVVPGSLHQWTAGLPFGARFVASLVVGEFGFYWGHRLMHEVPLLWRFHAVHHSAGQLDWLVNTRAHPVDMVFTRLCGFIPLYIVGLAQPTAKTVDILPLLIILTGTVWGFFIHSNLKWRFGWLEWLVATPAFHHWHHTNDGPALINKNYSAMVPWVDKLFGTFYLPKQWPVKYGIDGAMAPGLVGQMLQPFDYRKAGP